MDKLTDFLHRGWPLILLLTGIALYGHTLDVPMYLDDISSISDNPAVHNLADWRQIFAFSELRFVGYLSFALNYAVHGTELAGYHLFNIAVHLATAATLYLFVIALGETPATIDATYRTPLPTIALFAALIFLVHPLNTQAITYIVQRLASLAALFYLLSLYSFVKGRLSKGLSARLWFVICGFAALLAVLTKQNAVTLPVALLLLEYCFFAVDQAARGRVLRVVVWMLGGGLIVLAMLNVSEILTLDTLDSLTRETTRITRLEYLASQTLVIWRYIGLFFWPYPLVLDYGLEPTWRFSDWQVLAATAGHCLVLGVAAAYVRKFPLAAFGVLFYYLAHLVESSVIPIKDLMFEHRSYLPNVGLCVALVLPMRLLSPRALGVVVLVWTVILGILTWQRNNLWRDQVAFFNDAIEHAPGQPRNWVYLSKVYHKSGENAVALEFLSRELTANEQRNGQLRVDTATLVYWAKLLRLNGQDAKADEVEGYLAKLATSPQQRQRLLLNRGNAYLQAGEYQQAAEVYRELLALNPAQESAAVNLGVVALLQGNYAEAVTVFERFPDHPVAKANLPSALAGLEGNFEARGLEEQVLEKAQ